MPTARVELLIADCAIYITKQHEPIALDYVTFVASEKVTVVLAARLPTRMLRKDRISPIAIVKRIETNSLQDVMQLHQQAAAVTRSVPLDPFPQLPNRNA